MTIEAFAPAKINLTLHVTGRRSDGYHLLDSVVVFSDLGDRLWLEPGAAMSLEVTGPFTKGVPGGADNLVWRAAALAGFKGHIRLEKNLPNGAGLGGGSADAAAVLRILEAPSHALDLGADVPVCLTPKAQRMQGIGELLSPLQGIPQLWAVLVNPGVPVPTPAVFDALEKKQNPGMIEELPQFRSGRELVRWLAAQRNDLEAPTISVAPVVDEVLRMLSQTNGVALSRMSGSGATCFGLYLDRGLAELAAGDLEKAQPTWWVRDCQLS